MLCGWEGNLFMALNAILRSVALYNLLLAVDVATVQWL